MNWRYVKATKDQYFLTTDNPAFFFEYYGLGTDNSELTFPVSSELAIYGIRAPNSTTQIIKNRTQFVKEANRRLISEATRFVYYRSRAEWIASVAGKDKPYLSRIMW